MTKRIKEIEVEWFDSIDDADSNKRTKVRVNLNDVEGVLDEINHRHSKI